MRGKRPHLIPDNEAEPAWAQLVGWAARAKLRNTIDELAPAYNAGRWRVEIVFTLIPPPNKRRTNRRDLDKLARSILDALTGLIYRDDEQVEELNLRKCVGEKPGAVIRLTPIL